VSIFHVNRLAPLALCAAWVATAFVFLEPLSLAAETSAEARRIEARFVSPCCWRENLAVHDSPVAKQLRSEIAQMVASGQTESQIVDEYVARYGERILREPRGARFQILTITPIAVLGIGCLFVIWFLSRARRRNQDYAGDVALPAATEDEIEWL
jgi:cytochrome c-type biogenesis protein CcmH